MGYESFEFEENCFAFDPKSKILWSGSTPKKKEAVYAIDVEISRYRRQNVKDQWKQEW